MSDFIKCKQMSSTYIKTYFIILSHNTVFVLGMKLQLYL